MIDKDFYVKIKYRLMTGESSLSFKQLMLSDYSKWDAISLKEIEVLLELIKNNKFSLYAFIPFWYSFIGVNLFELYKRLNEHQWDSQIGHEVIENFAKYPKELSMIDIRILAENNLSLASFREIRKRLIAEGLAKVKYVSVIF